MSLLREMCYSPDLAANCHILDLQVGSYVSLLHLAGRKVTKFKEILGNGLDLLCNIIADWRNVEDF
jgi:hypothetical protein